jgi:hypothetical protein
LQYQAALNPAGLQDPSFWSGVASKPIRYPRHLGGSLKFSLNISIGATFFLGVSESSLNIGTSALFFFVPSGWV